MARTPEEFAAYLVTEHATEVEFMTIGEAMLDEYEHLTEDEFDTFQRQVDELISRAEIEVHFREEE